MAKNTGEQKPEAKAPEAKAPETPEVEIKQAVVTPASFGRLKVPGLTGTFGKAVFGNDNITVDPVDEETANQIFQQFGSAVKEVD